MSIIPYFIRKHYYRFCLLKRFMKYPYWGPWEMVEPMLEIPFEIFCEYYEKQDIANIGRLEPCEDDPSPELTEFQNKTYDTKDRLYKWWTEDYPRRQEELDCLEEEWGLHFTFWSAPYKDNTECRLFCCKSSRYGAYLFNLLMEEEQKFEEEKKQALFDLIEIRNTLWR